MKRIRKMIVWLLITLFLLNLSACSGENAGSMQESPGQAVLSEETEGSQESEPSSEDCHEESVSKADYEKETPEEGNISDNDELYKDEDEDSVITMHLTVSSGNSADGSDHTWTEINTYSAYDYEAMETDRYQVEGKLLIDDGDGIAENDFGYGAEIPNVSVQIRGQTSSRYDQKSYKIRIKKGIGSWQGQRTLDLNKHQMAPFRFNNKLAYDLLEDIPELLSGRTQFVHLYVTDTTEGGSGTEEDYGLYVMVEQVNRTYLKNHGLDDKGELYKVNFFEWMEYEPVMADPDSEDYDKKAFEEYLEIKGREDHTTLQNTIEELQNYQIPIQEIVEKHFNTENLMYWLAFQILIGNYDSGPRNLFLYSPLNSERFYVISWDMDVCFLRNYYESIDYSEGASWECGMTQYLSLTLFNRMFKEEEYRLALDSAIKDLKDNYLTEEKISRMVSGYSDVVTQYLFTDPDLKNSLFSDKASYLEAAAKIAGEVEENYELYLESLKKPWPFYIDLPTASDTGVTLSWQNSYDYRGESVTYDYILASDYEFKNILSEGHDLTVPTAQVGKMEPGTYYLKVTATNTSGYTIDSYDYYAPSGNIGKVYGCYEFTIKSDGNISAGSLSEAEG